MEENINKLSDESILILADLIEKLSWEIWIEENQRQEGDIVELEGKNGRFEGVVILVKRESFYTCIDDTYKATLEWDRPVGYRKERWLVEWLPTEGFPEMKSTYPSKWFTQAVLQGKRSHRTLMTPTRDLDVKLGEIKLSTMDPNSPNWLDKFRSFDGTSVY